VDANGVAKDIKVAKIKRMSTVDGQVQQISPTKDVPVKGLPDVRVTSGSALPYAKAQKTNAAMQYYTNQAIDREELLKSVNWPNYEEVLRRMQEKEQQAAAAEGAPA
jgi:hypothetical protein